MPKKISMKKNMRSNRKNRLSRKRNINKKVRKLRSRKNLQYGGAFGDSLKALFTKK